MNGNMRLENSLLSCQIELPADFRPGDVLAFHRRDPLMVAERVDTGSLQKGLTWQGGAACLTIRFYPRHADAELVLDVPTADSGAELLETMVRRMLGLTQRIGEFEQTYRADPQLGALLARSPGLRVPLAATPFEALTWAITGQQISVGSAVSIRRRLIQGVGLRHSGGLYCHPDARLLAGMTESDLRLTGLSQTKARTLLTLSQLVQDKLLPIDLWLTTLPVDEIRARLMLVRGIGPWTVNYALLRGFGWLDGSLHGDVAVRRGLQALLGSPEKISPADAESWLAQFSPWRALIAAHLWALQSSAGY